MAVAPWLLDSNAVMGWLNADPAPGFQACMERCLGNGAAVSVITVIEVLGWRGHTDQSREDAERLLRSLVRVELSPDVVQRTIALRSARAIKLPDAVIAASALALGGTLVTRNRQDFDHIEGLPLLDPYGQP